MHPSATLMWACAATNREPMMRSGFFASPSLAKGYGVDDRPGWQGWVPILKNSENDKAPRPYHVIKHRARIAHIK